MNNILVIAPHPDDETLGCGGTLLREKQNGAKIHWLIVTSILEKEGWKKDKILKREREIKKVSNLFKFDSINKLNLPTTKLDDIPISIIVQQISSILNKVKPNIIFSPFCSDIHSDHKIVTQAVLSNLKWFRKPYIKKVLYYETLSETHINFNKKIFNPNFFVDISKHLNKKISIMKIYESEFGNFPFPRSELSIKSLAYFRGSNCGFKAAEAFELIYEKY